MTKSDFVYVIAEKTGLTKRDAERATDAVFEAVTEILCAGPRAVPGLRFIFGAPPRGVYRTASPNRGAAADSGNRGAGF